jgi:hypothetical protein
MGSNCPDPGIYDNIEPEEYFSWDAVSNSRLSLLNRSPLHYQHGFTESTPAMRLGSLVHAGVLEPLAIMQRYVVMPNYANHPDNKTGKGERSFSSVTTFVKSMEEQFRKLHHDKELVTEEQYKTMVGMASSIAGNEQCSQLFRGGRSEQSVVWIDERSGLRCKCRADWLSAGRMVDLKTTQDPTKFDSAIANYGYHRQMAFYQAGFAALGIDVEPWIVCIEKTAPYGVRCGRMGQDAIEVGGREVRALLQQLAECMEENDWPGYRDPDVWRLPSWYGESTGDAVELVIGGEVVSV